MGVTRSPWPDTDWISRQAYARQVRSRGCFRVDDLPQADQDVLALARPRNERNPGDSICLRTYYGPGSDDALAAILAIFNGDFPVGGMGLPGHDCLFSDVRYAYGDAWQRIFGRMPQLLEYASPDVYEAARADALQTCQGRERRDKERVEEEGGEWPRDAMYIGDVYNYYHIASKIRLMYVLDEVTLSGEKRPEDRRILAVWHDPDGRIVRSCRVSADEVDSETAVLNSGSISDMPTWMDAEIGDDYNWDGILGPPPIESGEEDEDEG